MKESDFSAIAYWLKCSLGSHPSPADFDCVEMLVEQFKHHFDGRRYFSEQRFSEEVGLKDCYYELRPDLMKKLSAEQRRRVKAHSSQGRAPGDRPEDQPTQEVV